jgi:hypothetical protein
MNEPFDISFLYEGKDLSFTAKLIRYGYSHKISVDVHGTEVCFEPDEEGNYRAIIDPAQLEHNRNISVPLLRGISEAIETILK